jgi:hypothetical protein
MSEGTTKKPAGRSRGNAADDLADEYQFDYSQSRPNRFASDVDEDAVVVVLDPDVAEVVREPKHVNALLRAAIAAVGKRRAGRAG